MKRIILFDGVCHFCQKNVQFIIKHDPNALFQFASLQSPIGKKLLDEFNVPPHEDSLILLENDRYYSKSSAALRISKQLTTIWKLLYLLIVIPKPIRDVFYNIIAKNRYTWFGRSNECMIPPPSIRNRFLD